MSGKPTALATSISVDDALVQGATYQFDGIDRQYIDTQIRAVQQHLVDSVLRGVHATWIRLDGASAAGAAGDVVCLVGSSTATEPTVTRAVTGALAGGGGVYGVLLRASAPGALALVAGPGSILPPTLTGLPGSGGRFAYVNGATARLARTSSLTGTEYVVGTCDAPGWLAVNVQPSVTAAAAASGIVLDQQIVTGTGTINNLALASSTTSLLTFTGAGTVNLTGIVAPSNERMLYLSNRTGNVLTLKQQTTSSVANQFDLRSSTDLLINNRGGATIVYDRNLTFWTAVSVCA